MKEYIIGIDIAKNQDRTAIAIGHMVQKYQPDGRNISYLDILDMQLMEQMSYPDLARYIRKLDLHAKLHGNNELVVDSTGVGEAVCDNLVDIGLNPNRIIFTGGDNASVKVQKGPSGFVSRVTNNVPKHELIDVLKLMMQEGRIRIAQGIPFEADIKEQFSHFVGKMSKSKNMIYGNDKDDIHDDIVCALAMMAWWFMQNMGAREDFRYEVSLAPGKRMSFKGRKRTTDYDFTDTI